MWAVTVNRVGEYNTSSLTGEGNRYGQSENSSEALSRDPSSLQHHSEAFTSESISHTTTDVRGVARTRIDGWKTKLAPNIPGFQRLNPRTQLHM